MTKKIRLILIISILMLLIFCLLTFLITNLYGPRTNDAFAKKLINILETIQMPDGIDRLETSGFVGKLKDDGQFIIWVGIAIKTDKTPQELETVLKAIPAFEKAEILPYELDLANKLHFSGIQKELVGTEVKDIYIVGVTTKPRTIFDKRNK